jgi:AcrR family transcriptional regulator
MGLKRARTEAEKADKKKLILDSAWRLFAASGGELPTAARIAREAGVSKGTLYVYFKTKEQIFLSLFPEKLWEWGEDASRTIEAMPGTDLDQVAEALIRYPLHNPLIMQLGGMLRGVLEANAPDEAIVEMKLQAVQVARDMGERLSRQLTWLSPQDGAAMLLSIYALLSGLWQHASLPERIMKKLSQASPEFFRADMSQAAKENVAALLTGLRARRCSR